MRLWLSASSFHSFWRCNSSLRRSFSFFGCFLSLFVCFQLFVRFQLLKRVGDVTSQHREVPLELLGPIVFFSSLVVIQDHYINSVIMGMPCMYFTHTALTRVDHFHFLSHMCYVVLPSFPMKTRATLRARYRVLPRDGSVRTTKL